MKVEENWTDKDFDVLSWHDSYIHSMSFPGENLKLSFDIDYLFEWILDKEENLYHFWVTPSLLVFYDVLHSKINFDFENSAGLQINAIKRANQRLSPNEKEFLWDYTIETDKGVITFETSGFLQKVRN